MNQTKTQKQPLSIKHYLNPKEAQEKIEQLTKQVNSLQRANKLLSKLAEKFQSEVLTFSGGINSALADYNILRDKDGS